MLKIERTAILITVYPQIGDLLNAIDHNRERNIFLKFHSVYWQIDEPLAETFLVRIQTLLC